MANVDINKLISAITSATGKPYVWGASGPNSFDCSGLIYWAFQQCGVTIPRITTDQYAAGTTVSWDNIKPGDLLFNADASHVLMYIGDNSVIHAPHTGDVVKIVSANSYKGYTVKRLNGVTGEYTGGTGSNSSTASSGGTSKRQISTTASFKTNSSTDWLLDPTDDERKYGPNFYDGEQPLIKFSTYRGISESGSCTEALKNYSEFLYYLLNSEMSTAQVTCIGMPWIRPGFNIWFDPIYSDTIYYCTNVQHQGDPSRGATTSLTLVLGRDRKTYSSNREAFGSMKDKNDNVMMNEYVDGYRTKNFGECYDSNESFENFKNAALNYYETEAFETVDARDSEFHKQVYEYCDDTSPTPKNIDSNKVFSKSYTEEEISTQLNNLYSSAPEVVKNRVNKLSDVMTKAKDYVDKYHVLEKHTFG